MIFVAVALDFYLSDLADEHSPFRKRRVNCCEHGYVIATVSSRSDDAYD